MSKDEVAEAKALIRRMQLPIMAVPTRRFRPGPQAGGSIFGARCASRCAAAARFDLA